MYKPNNRQVMEAKPSRLKSQPWAINCSKLGCYSVDSTFQDSQTVNLQDDSSRGFVAGVVKSIRIKGI